MKSDTRTILDIMALDRLRRGYEGCFGKITHTDFKHLPEKYGILHRNTYKNLDYFHLKTSFIL